MTIAKKHQQLTIPMITINESSYQGGGDCFGAWKSANTRACVRQSANGAL